MKNKSIKVEYDAKSGLWAASRFVYGELFSVSMFDTAGEAMLDCIQWLGLD